MQLSYVITYPFRQCNLRISKPIKCNVECLLRWLSHAHAVGIFSGHPFRDEKVISHANKLRFIVTCFDCEKEPEQEKQQLADQQPHHLTPGHPIQTEKHSALRSCSGGLRSLTAGTTQRAIISQIFPAYNKIDITDSKCINLLYLH